MKLINSYLYIPVSNFDKSVEWYQDVFGFKLKLSDPLYRDLESHSGIRIMLIERRNNINSHMMYDTGAQASYGFMVKNIQNVHSELISKGVKVTEIGDYQGKSFSFFDPDDNKIEIWEEDNELQNQSEFKSNNNK